MAYVDNTILGEHISEREIIQLCDEERLAVDDTTLAAAVVSNTAIQDRIDRAITNASTIVDSWVRKQFEVPVKIDSNGANDPANTPLTIQMLVSQLTLANLFKRRMGEFTELPATVKDTKAGAMEMLKAINRGEIDLGLTPAPAKSEYVIATHAGEERAFTEETLEDF